MLENHNVIVSTQSLYYDQIKYRQTSIGTPVPRNDAVDQVEVLIEDLNVRTKPSIHGDSLGYATKGIYNIHDVGKAGDYTWYEIEPDKWIAFSEKWARYYPKRTAAQLYSVTFVVTEGDVKGLQEYGKTIGVTPTVTEIK
jgi:hypothetical protein